MIPWILLDKYLIPDNDKELRLYQRDTEYSIKIGGYELMNNRAHNSEDALGKLACQRIKNKREQRMLIGGLGMGFTLRAALNNLKSKADVTVAELFPIVVKWNHDHLAHLAKNPLDDKRVTVYEGNVADKINDAQGYYDAILMDVDNGAQGLTQETNDSLYTVKGLKSAYAALKLNGVLAIWSAVLDEKFTRRLQKVGFKVEEVCVPTRSGRKLSGHSIVWVAGK